MSEMVNNPAKLLEQQVQFWGKSVKHYIDAQQQLMQGTVPPPEDSAPKDRRFAHELWQTNPYFSFIKQQYMINADAVRETIAGIETMDDNEKRRLEFFGQQIVDMVSPTNFLATNPEALSLAAETDGESLVLGLENLIRDLEANDGDLVVTLADKDAFQVGENLATSPGDVVFRNRLFELIQYTPSTEKVYETPLLIFPPWINKFYIMDLKPANSLIKWAVEDDFVDGIENEVSEQGILDKFYMSRTFSYLRSNDLIYGPAIRSYMLGKAPPAFDLLYWNGDGTNLPGKMAIEYLRGLCQNDNFASDGMEICGTTVRLSEVSVPICAIACETDHIAAWKSSYRGVQAMGATDKTFILSESGHIAGIINPPTKKKYGHYTNPEMGLAPDDWLADADKHEGSWWPRWDDWLSKKSGKKIKARKPGSKTYPVIAPAPGTYVVK